ncbi:MAG TPA: MFS transporter [Galbitalea sp.]|jgi:MFS family permease
MTINASGLNPEELSQLPPVADALNPVTPFKRLMGSMATSYAGAFIVQAVPVNLLLTVKLTTIAGPGAAVAFSLVTGVAAVIGLIVQPLTGRLSDRSKSRFGKRRSWIFLGGLASSVLVIGMLFTNQVWQVVVVWAIVSIFINVQFAATGALLAEQVPAKRRGAMSGVLGSMAILGPVLGLGAVNGATHQPWLQWVIVGVSGIILVVVSVALLKDPQQTRPDGETRLRFLEVVKSYWLSPRKHPAFGWAWAVRFLVSCTGAALTYNALLLINRFHYTKEAVQPQVLLLTLLYGVFIIIFSTVGGVLSDRIKRQKPFVIVASVVAAVALILIGTAPNVPTLFVATGILGIGAGIFLSVDLAMSVRMLPNPENVGKDIAVMGLASTLPSAFVPAIAPLFLLLGGYTLLYVAIAVLGLIGAVLVLRLPELGHEGDPRWALLTRAELVKEGGVE